MNIYEMVNGEKYLIEDGLGLDIVTCVKQDYIPDVGLVVIVLFEENGEEDFLFEDPVYPFDIKVQPVKN